jgi:hypothetical protein
LIHGALTGFSSDQFVISEWMAPTFALIVRVLDVLDSPVSQTKELGGGASKFSPGDRSNTSSK